MIFLAPPILIVQGLTIFRDDTDPLQFYYYPTQPKLALNPDGTPTFLFIKFAAGDTPAPAGVEVGGGFLNFDADLRVDDGALDSARRAIRQQMSLDQDPRLVPLLYRAGSTRLIFLDAQPQAVPAPSAPAAPHPVTPTPVGTTGPVATGPGSPGTPTPVTMPTTTTAAPAGTPDAVFRFVENASYATTPALIGDNRTAFSIQLSPWGAQVVEQSLDASTFLAGVVYDLTFVALRPAYSVELKIDWDRVYDFVEQHFAVSAKVWFVAAQSEIDDAVEKLQEQRAIELKVVSYAAGAADDDIVKQKDAAVDTVKKLITDAFFTPSLQPTPPSTPSSVATVASSVKQATSPVTIGYTRKHVEREDVKHLTVNFTEQDATEVRIVPQGHLAGLMAALKSWPRDQFVRSIAFDDPFFQRYKVAISASNAIATDKIDDIQVNLRYGPANEVKSVLLNATTSEASVEWALDPALGWAVDYDLSITFRTDAAVGASNTIKAGPFHLVGSRLTLDPRQFYALLRIDVQAVGIPWDRYAQIEVDLEYADPANGIDLRQSVTLNPAAPTAAWSVRLSDPRQTGYRAKSTLYPINGPVIAGDWQPAEQSIVTVRDPFAATLKVLMIAAVDFTKVSRLLVTLSYEDPANGIDQTDVITLKSLDDLITWTVHIADGKKRDYTYAVTTQYRDGSVKVLPPVPSSSSQLSISSDYKRTVTVTISASGQSFAQANLSHVDVTLNYDDDANDQHVKKIVTLRATSDTDTFVYTVLDPDRSAYTYEVLWAGADGFSRRQAAQAVTDQHLVLPIGS